MKLALVVALAACGGGASPPVAPSPAPLPAAARPPPAPATPSPVAASAPQDEQCPPEWQPSRDAHALGGLTFERTYVKDTGDKTDHYIGRRDCQKVLRCFDAIPKDQRSTTAVYQVVIEWPNALYEGKGGGGYGGLGRSGFGAGGGGGGPRFPTTTDAAFTACVTAAIPEERISTLDDEKRVIRAVRYTVRAYTPPVGDRYFTGSIGHP